MSSSLSCSLRFESPLSFTPLITCNLDLSLSNLGSNYDKKEPRGLRFLQYINSPFYTEREKVRLNLFHRVFPVKKSVWHAMYVQLSEKDVD